MSQGGRIFSAVLASHIIFSCITFVFLQTLFKEQQIQPECTVPPFLNFLGQMGFVVDRLGSTKRVGPSENDADKDVTID